MAFQTYADKGRNSNVVAYEYDDKSIRVQFLDGMVYEYTRDSCGQSLVNDLKSAARRGVGLNSLIMTRAKTLYAAKWKV